MATNLHLIATGAAALTNTPVVACVHFARDQFDHDVKWCVVGVPNGDGAEEGLESQ
jgi:hypothetical protein